MIKNTFAICFNSIILLAVASALSFAGVRWTTNGVAICTANGWQQVPELVADGSGGAIVIWNDSRAITNSDVYAQKVSKAGINQWTIDGVPISTAAENQEHRQLISDGAGGAIIVWTDNRNGVDTNKDIYAQKISSSGVVQWTLNGLPVCTAANNQEYPQLVSDGAGGAIITWTDKRDDSNGDIYAQRIDSNGAAQWTANGVIICNLASYQFYPKIISDNSGGAIITWWADANGVFAQKINASGIVQWTVNGVVLESNSAVFEPQMTDDGAGGAIVVWTRSGGNVYTQRISNAGTVQWAANGVLISSAAQGNNPQIYNDGGGGAILSWSDSRNGNNDIFAQKINSSGVVQWTANGISICTNTASQTWPQLVNDGMGGAIIVWPDDRGVGLNNIDIYAQRIDSNGVVQWTANGDPIATAAFMQSNHKITSDGSGGAIISWHDYRTGLDTLNPDIYAQRVSNSAPSVSSIAPNTANNNGSISITNLSGTWFSNAGSNPIVKLTKTGQSDVVATNVSVISATKITCDFNLTDKYYQQWNISVINSDDQIGTLSTGFTINDVSAPSSPDLVRDGLAIDVGWTNSLSGLSANWDSAIDIGSGIAKYWYAIGTGTSGTSITNVVDWTDAGNVTTVTKTGLTLSEGQTYYFSVKAENGAGLQGLATNSNGQKVDSTVPSGVPTPPTDAGDLSYSKTISLSWTPGNANDSESGIAGYYLQVGTTAGSNDKYDEDVGNVTTHSITNCAYGKRYYARVRARNGAGAYTDYSGSSDGILIYTPNEIKVTNNLFNPTNGGSVKVQYSLPEDTSVKITVHKSNGEKVRALIDQVKAAGVYTDLIWDGKDDQGQVVSSGVYIVFIDAGAFKDKKRVIIAK